MSRAYNFCAGPAALPTDVLEQARQEMLDYQGMGLSIMEMSHRDKVFVEIAKGDREPVDEDMEGEPQYSMYGTPDAAQLAVQLYLWKRFLYNMRYRCISIGL